MAGGNSVRAALGALVCLASASSAIAAEAKTPHFDGATLHGVWAVPFVGLLLSIAVMPLAAPHLWHRHYGKIAVLWALAFLVPFALFYGIDIAVFEFLHVMLLDYVPFIVLLFALYTISGGVYLKGDIHGTLGPTPAYSPAAHSSPASPARPARRSC